MSELGSSDDSNESLISGYKKNKRQLFQENGVEMWAMHHTVCLGASALLAVLCLGFVAFRFNKILGEEQKEAEALRTTPARLSAPPDSWESRFEVLGCYPLQNGDFIDAPNLRDPRCMQKNVMGVPCRSGLPFYRLAFETVGGARSPVSIRMCAAYCLFKGFDVSGVVNAVECRCGATEPNLGIWHDQEIAKNRLDLLWQPPWNKVPSNSSKCAIMAVRFTGPVPIVGLSFDRTNEDIVYVRSIVQGEQVKSHDTDITAGAGGKGSSVKRLVLSEATGPPQQAWLRSSSVARLSGGKPPRQLQLGTTPEVRQALNPCYPGQCSSGLSWPILTDFKRTGIPYAFSDSVDEVTRKIFLSVIQELDKMTCLNFMEVSPFYNRTYKIRVRGDKNGCFTNFLGYPAAGLREDIEINLGWCKTELEKGNIVHELCHALGMGHEHTRPDRDAYVQIKWEMLATANDRAQYEVNPNAYVGSEQAGPMPYDFESIMHYPVTDAMMTKPIVNGRGSHDSQIGQRQQLSPGDVFQLRNMYRCDAEEIPCADDDAGLQKYGPYEGPGGTPVTCAELAVNNLCSEKNYGQDVRYFCPKSCDACPEQPKQPVEVEGCQDVPGFEDVCKVYSDFCPGKVPGYEDWMTQRCRRTCFIERFCGTSTTVRVQTTTLAPTLPPGVRSVAMRMDFDIVGGAFNIKDKKEQVMLSKSLQARAVSEFGAPAKVDTKDVGDNKGQSTVHISCGCDPSLRLACSIPCKTLKHHMMLFTYQHDSLNQAFKSQGFGGLQVTNAFMASGKDRISAFFYSGWVLHSACIIGGIAVAASIGLLVYYSWIHTEHKDSPAGRATSYQEMSERDPET